MNNKTIQLKVAESCLTTCRIINNVTMNQIGAIYSDILTL